MLVNLLAVAINFIWQTNAAAVAQLPDRIHLSHFALL
jgi:hypothetical protein